MNKVQMKWHLIGLNELMEIIVMDRRQHYRKKYAESFTEEVYIEEVTQEYVALDKYVVFGERYGNELLAKLKQIGGTRRSLWYEKDPEIENDILFSEQKHMFHTRYSSQSLLKIAQMSSNTRLCPRYSSIFSLRHNQQLPTTGDNLAQKMLQEATYIDLSNYKASYTDGRNAFQKSAIDNTLLLNTLNDESTSSTSAITTTGKRKESSSPTTCTTGSSESSLKHLNHNERHFMMTGKYSRIQAYRVIFRNGTKVKGDVVNTKKNAKNHKAQLANISQALVRFFVKSKVLHFHNQDLTSVFVKCDNTNKILAGTLHCYEKPDHNSKPMFDPRAENSDEEDDECTKGIFKFNYDNIDNCYEWKIALSKSQNDIFLQTEMVTDIVGRDGTSMKPYVTFPILTKQSSYVNKEGPNYKRKCIEDDR
jgi:hypothetical protein